MLVKRTVFAIFAIALVMCSLVIVAELLATRPSASDVTISTMTVLRNRLIAFSVEHGRLPLTLDELPPREGMFGTFDDAWHRRIIYRVLAGEIVDLTSYGRDGLPGGTGEDRDIVRSFQVRDGNGQRGGARELPNEWLRGADAYDSRTAGVGNPVEDEKATNRGTK